MWKGKLPREIFEIGQEGYVSAGEVTYPEGIEVIDCELGTSPLGMSERLCRLLKEGKTCNLCDYPEPEPNDLKVGIVKAHSSWKISPEEVLVGGGSIGVLVSLFRVLLRPGSVMLGVSPQFTDVPLQALYNGALYESINLEAPRYSIDKNRILEALDRKPEVLYIDRPNNPTGQVLSLDDLAELARAAMKTGTWVIADEAYGDFLPDEESAAVLDFPNLIICRSFSKGLGVAGIRVGFAVCRDRELAALYRKIQPPFVIGTLDACIALEVLKDGKALEEVRDYVKKAKSKVLELVSQKQGWSVADTDQRVPIFLLSQEAGNIVKRLADVGIACAPGSGYFNLDDRSARLRVPSPDKLEAFLERLNIIGDIP